MSSDVFDCFELHVSRRGLFSPETPDGGLLRASSLPLQNAVLEILVNWPVYFLSDAFVID